jgi:hypothetical protein
MRPSRLRFTLTGGKIYYGDLLIMELDDYALMVKKATDVESVELEVDVGDKLYADLVAHGKNGATNEDYFRIGFTSAIMKSLEFEECKSSGQLYLDLDA